MSTSDPATTFFACSSPTTARSRSWYCSKYLICFSMWMMFANCTPVSFRMPMPADAKFAPTSSLSPSSSGLRYGNTGSAPRHVLAIGEPPGGAVVGGVNAVRRRVGAGRRDESPKTKKARAACDAGSAPMQSAAESSTSHDDDDDAMNATTAITIHYGDPTTAN
uniref:Uncharacterized protein n=1 Tax=Oryza glumipatula TaxID=40148 RepID=A0A0D9Z037_9ORYZ